MKTIGVLWDEEVTWDGEKPFDGQTNEAYGYFSERARDQGVRLVQAQYHWYEDGSLSRGWVYEDGFWSKVENVELDGVFDKFHFDEETKALKKEINNEIGILNDPELEELCKDKLLTYERFLEMMPETRPFSEENVREMLEEYGKIVLKPCYAFGGKGIHIVDDEEDLPEIEEDYIVQRFIDSSAGIEGIVEGTHDLRGIVVNGELKAGYVRYSDGEISNVSQGGSQHAVSPEDFPEQALEIIETVNDELEYRPCLFSVDLFFDENGRPWIVELNSKPGIGFYGDEEMKQQLVPVMDALVEAFKQL
ncbi:ATP-grasp domain-containing protein [Candidatus Nanohalovita haloferacivicina]|uniref:ATP-grasp domain-containing protein n=1 Tax=Candidatus Nanohalovita haloferacivicina TaxID=2978046 RepID=UPI00325FCB1D|nr:Glutathione synthase [Candidatus Nanohalobia archaeon BNXNv]